MPSNNRISNFDEIDELSSFNLDQVPEAYNPNIGNQDDDVLFLITTSGQTNQKIKFKNLKKSILDSSVLLTGDQNIRGSKTFIDDCTFEGGLNVDSYTVENFIFHKDDLDTYIQFEDSKINLSANQEVNINVSGKTLSVNNTGSVAINSSDHLGALTVSGNAYFDDVYIKNDLGTYSQISGFTESSVNFSSSIPSGQSEYSINFPKTFESSPTISIALESPSSPIIPYRISNISEFDYTINFDNPIPDESYKIHTVAKPIGESSFRQTKTVSMIKNLTAGSSSFSFNYPEAFVAPPILSLSLESDTFSLPFLITSNNNSSFSIEFDSNLPDSAKLHIHATR